MLRKTTFLLVGLMFLAVSAVMGQEEAATDGPILTFESLVVDYGEIDQHSEPLRVAKFTNTGTEPLVIKSARGSCGCTVPKWPETPVMPGETSQIEIRYDTKRIGNINKTVTITTNAGGKPVVLKVKGKINKLVEEESVPAAKGGLFKKDSNK